MKNRNVVIGCGIVFLVFFLFVVFVATVSQVFVKGRSADSASAIAGRLSSGGGGDRVGVVYVSGVIRSGGQSVGLFGDDESGSDSVVRALEKGRASDRVKAIVIRVNSPGGSAAASQEIYEAIMRVRRDKKPVVISMGDIAASGGYYVASAGDVVFAAPATLTGSIGVIMQYLNFEGTAEKFGALPVTIKSGEHKDIGSPFRQLSDEERALLQNVLDSVHTQFIRDVAKGRRLDEKTIRAIADGRIFTGEQALENKLVDKLGGLHDAVEYAAKRAGVTGEPDVEHLQRALPVFGFQSLGERALSGVLNRRGAQSIADVLLLAPYLSVE